MQLVPQGNAPPNGGTVSVGDRFVLGLWLNAGSHTDVTAHQSYISFTWQLLQNVHALGGNCVPTNTVTGDLTTFDAVLQNEVCNDPFHCVFPPRGYPGWMAYASGAWHNPPAGGYFRVAQIGLCAVAPGQALLHWQFAPPDPITRDTEIVDVNWNILSDRTLFSDYVINIVAPTSTSTHTPTRTPYPTSTPGGNAFMELVPEGNAPPNGGAVSVGDRFVLGLWLNSGMYPNALAQQSYISFTYGLIKNASVSEINTSCVLTSMVKPDIATFDAALQNEVCNGPSLCFVGHQQVLAGWMAYASGAIDNPPSGGRFRVAQIGLCAIAPGQAYLRWQFSPPDPVTRDTYIIDSNGGIISDRALFTDYFINIVTPTPTPALLTGHVTWQGRPPQPDPLQQLPVTLTLKMGNVEVNYPAQTTDASGFFTVSVAGLTSGVYDWRVKGPEYLANAGTVTLLGFNAATSVEVGLMKVGDSNDDNAVDINDFSIVQRSFGRTIGDGRYDERAEFTGNSIVNVIDFNFEKMNFGQSGAPPIRP